jgi:predicted chitinase
MITAAQVKRFAPGARADIVKALVDGADEMRAAGINTDLRLQHFMSQIYPETGGLKFLEENLRYSAKRLQQVWPGRFPTPASAQPFANNPEALANKVYGGRLGNKQPGDGWRYRGRGMMQTTGRSNYRAAGREDDPDALASPEEALRSALTFWKDNGCNAIADRDDVGALRKRINGGTHGLADARDALAKAKRIFKASGPVTVLDSRRRPIASFDTIQDAVDSISVDRIRSEAPEPITDPHQVSLVQTWLRNLGYTEVGTPDGKMGSFTRAAITAYRADKGLPLGDWIDDELLLMLAKDKEPRQVAPERANADSAKVASVAPEARQNLCSKMWAGFAAVLSGIGAFGQGVLSQFQAAKEYIAPVQDMLSDVPTWIWFAAAAGIAGYIWNANRKAGDEITAAVQSGARR